MSDIFDHELDAYEDDYLRNGDVEDTDPYRSYNFTPDPLYYHMAIDCIIIEEVGESYLIKYEGIHFHIPQSICREIEDDCMYVHKQIFNQILKKQNLS